MIVNHVLRFLLLSLCRSVVCTAFFAFPTYTSLSFVSATMNRECARTHTIHTHTLTRARAHVHAYVCEPAHTRTQTRMHARTHTHARALVATQWRGDNAVTFCCSGGGPRPPRSSGFRSLPSFPPIRPPPPTPPRLPFPSLISHLNSVDVIG